MKCRERVVRNDDQGEPSRLQSNPVHGPLSCRSACRIHHDRAFPDISQGGVCLSCMYVRSNVCMPNNKIIDQHADASNLKSRHSPLVQIVDSDPHERTHANREVQSRPV